MRYKKTVTAMLCVCLAMYIMLVGCSNPKEQTLSDNELYVDDNQEEIDTSDDFPAEERDDTLDEVVVTENETIVDENNEISSKCIIEVNGNQYTKYKKFTEIVLENLNEEKVFYNKNLTISQNVFEGLKLLGEVEDSYYFLLKGDSSSIIKTNREMDEFDVFYPTISEVYDCKLIKDSSYYEETVFLSKLNNSYIVYNLEFEVIDEKKLPDDLIQYESSLDNEYWDVSNDFELFTYLTAEKGFILYNVNDGSVTHIDEDTYIAGGHGSRGWFMLIPEFCVDNTYVSVLRMGTYWIEGYSIYNIDDKELTYLNGAYSESIDGDRGFYVYGRKGETKGTYYDFEEGERIRRGIEADFAITALGYHGENILVDGQVISFYFDEDEMKYILQSYNIEEDSTELLSTFIPGDMDKAIALNFGYEAIEEVPEVWIIGIKDNEVLLFVNNSLEFEVIGIQF